MNEVSPLRPQGPFTIVAAQRQRELLLPAVQQPGQHVELDLSDIDAFDSAGVQLLLAARRSAIGHGGSFSVKGAGPLVTEVLAAYGLEALFRIRCG